MERRRIDFFLQRQGETYHIEHRVRLADGSYHWHLSQAIPVRDAQGRMGKWFGTATDNVVKHAGVNRAHVELSDTSGYLALSVTDQGRGFNPAHLDGGASKTTGLGLRSLRDAPATWAPAWRSKALPAEAAVLS